MTIAKRIFTILIPAVIAGCVPSLHELYTKETTVFDPDLVGCWETEDGERWYFTPQENRDAYHLVVEEKEDRRSMLRAHLVDLDGQRYLDLYPDEDAELCTGDWYKFHLLGVHTFLKVDATDPNLALAIMQPDRVQKLLEKKPALVPHEIVDDRVVLTGSPQRLQAFVKDPDIRKEIFESPVHLTRCEP